MLDGVSVDLEKGLHRVVGAGDCNRANWYRNGYLKAEGAPEKKGRGGGG